MIMQEYMNNKSMVFIPMYEYDELKKYKEAYRNNKIIFDGSPYSAIKIIERKEVWKSLKEKYEREIKELGSLELVNKELGKLNLKLIKERDSYSDEICKIQQKAELDKPTLRFIGFMIGILFSAGLALVIYIISGFFN